MHENAGESPPGARKSLPDFDSATLVGEESEPGGLAELPARLARLGMARKRTEQMGKYLLLNVAQQPDSGRFALIKNPGPEASEQDLAHFAGGRLLTCSTWLKFRHYETVEKVRLHDANFCYQPKLCPVCALRRSARNLGAYLDALELVQGEWLDAMREDPDLPPLLYYMVTLTVRNGPDLGERMGHLRRAVKRMTDRRRQALSGNGWGCTEWRKIFGAVGSYEVTNRGKGWHPHMHMLVVASDEIDRFMLKREWEKATGDSFIVDVQEIDASDEEKLVGAFVEVLKYSMKFQDLSMADNWRAHLQLRGMRMVVSIGCLYGVKEPPELRDEDTCKGLPYEELFYKYLPETGAYTLIREEKITMLDRAKVRSETRRKGERNLIRRQHSHEEIVQAASALATALAQDPPADEATFAQLVAPAAEDPA